MTEMLLFLAALILAFLAGWTVCASWQRDMRSIKRENESLNLHSDYDGQ